MVMAPIAVLGAGIQTRYTTGLKRHLCTKWGITAARKETKVVLRRPTFPSMQLHSDHRVLQCFSSKVQPTKMSNRDMLMTLKLATPPKT